MGDERGARTRSGEIPAIIELELNINVSPLFHILLTALTAGQTRLSRSGASPANPLIISPFEVFSNIAFILSFTEIK